MVTGQSKKAPLSRSMVEIKAYQEHHARGFVSTGGNISDVLNRREEEEKNMFKKKGVGGRISFING